MNDNNNNILSEQELVQEWIRVPNKNMISF